LLEKLEQITVKFHELEKALADPDIMKDMAKYKKLMQEHSGLQETVQAYKEFKEIREQHEQAVEISQNESDPEMKEMAKEEAKELASQLESIEKQLRTLLIPKDPLDSKNIIMEIRAGTGGDEAALFAADLYRMYTRFAETMKWKLELMDSNEIDLGGFKEVVFNISGNNVYENLRYESGVHRVQRVPSTESGGRIHTSAVTVAVLPEAEETEVEINDNELKIDVYRSSGPGGQSVNTTDSAVRITHLPTGIVVICQDEKSQHKNKAKALKVLRARLFEIEEAKKNAERSEARKSQIGSGDRSERIRTYNYPQNRITDHRINLTLYKLEQIMQGYMAELIDPLKVSAKEEALKELNS
jgi:peptide chain release factor 1